VNQPIRETIEIESQRIQDRLTVMPLSRADGAVIERVREAAQEIVDIRPDPQLPEGALLPSVGPSALAAQIGLVVRDYLTMQTQRDEQTATSEDVAVAEILIELRRSLP